jgi:TPR repeat protein
MPTYRTQGKRSLNFLSADDVEAVKWFRKAAEQGNAEAQLGLGVMYANGRGVPQNEVLAHRWWNLAGAQGHTIARKNMELIANYMTKEQIADAQRMAREWQVKHSGQGEE